MNDSDRNERAAVEILKDFRKGRISARLRDALLRDLGYDVPERKPRDYFKNPTRNGRGGVQGKG